MKKSTAKYLDKSLLCFMSGFVFLNPIPHTTTIKEILFYLSVVVFLILLSTKKIHFTYKTPLTIPFLLFGVWAFLGLFFALDKPSSIHDYYAHYIKYIIFYFIFINVFNTPKRFNMIVGSIIISAIGFSSWALIKYYVILGHSFSTRMGSATGLPEFITNISELSTILALLFSLNLIFMQRSITQRILLIIGLIPLLAATILPQSASSIISLTIALLFFFCNKPKLLFALTLGTVILFSVIPIPDRISSRLMKGDNSRIFLYLYSLEIIKDYPIMGTGFDLNVFRYIKESLPTKFQEYKNLTTVEKLVKDTPFFPIRKYETHNGPHNLFFNITIRTGLVGLLLFCFILVKNLQPIFRITSKEKAGHFEGWKETLIAAFAMFLSKGLFEQLFTHFGDTIFYLILALTTVFYSFGEEAHRTFPLKQT